MKLNVAQNLGCCTCLPGGTALNLPSYPMLLYSRTGQWFRVFLTQDLCRHNTVTEAFTFTPAFQKWHLYIPPVFNGV